MNWKDQLEDKAKELNLKERRTDNDERILRRSSGRDSVIRSGTVSRKVSATSRKNRINNINKGGYKEMITSKAALDDYEAICKKDIPANEKLVELFRIVIKLLLGIRTNQRGGVKKESRPRPIAKPVEKKD